MKTKDFDYGIPKELIAQEPLSERHKSKLLILDRYRGSIQHDQFKSLVNYLTPNDILVFNDTKVIKARLFGKRSTGAKVECFLSKPLAANLSWLALLKPARRLKETEIIEIHPTLKFKILKKNPQSGLHTIKFLCNGDFYQLLNKYGNVPLPPYINSTENTNQFYENYQTVFAENPGAVAAPTAGLHFSEELLTKLKKSSIQTETITLHVGYGTFKPIQTNKITDHSMHTENYFISHKTASRINKAYQENKNIIAVGTTVTRTLESAFNKGLLKSGLGKTSLYIYPGYKFKLVNGLITNFHLPKSSLLVLVSAFADRNNILNAYQEAIRKKYRLFSFGDAMFIK